MPDRAPLSSRYTDRLLTRDLRAYCPDQTANHLEKVLSDQRRPLTEIQRREHRNVVDGAWDQRNKARRELMEGREAAHAEIERHYYEAMSDVDSGYDNAIHEGLDELRRREESGS